MQRINTLAWKIRRKAATKHACNVMTINWSCCYNKAKNIIEKRQEKAIRRIAKRYAKRNTSATFNTRPNTGNDTTTTRVILLGMLLIPVVMGCLGMVMGGLL